ncbi:hypothetical protein Hypma_002398 [Hypsizygus marmoreus]|uniref:Uncharacterized protein n=1 Tax=Hypsizygus marmoreus TaxID=39966 RepID=A0A369J6Z6_HYPMA|nr:hypothetical protein Hypma_002398 [Hypsizygus marmoreus]
MSAVGNQEVLTPILLRSSTPAPNEKVLDYLEGMSREGVDNTPPRSIVDTNEYRSKAGSPRVRSPQLLSPAARSKQSDALLDLGNSPMSYTNRNGANAEHHNDGDADSNAQEGRTSEAGETILPVREPGPHDPPGPKYESYDSGPSFGNFGPLPMDDLPTASNNPFAQNSWNPNWSQIQSKPASQGPWGGEQERNGTEVGSAFPAAKVPLPPSEFAMSPRGTTADIGGKVKSRGAPSEREDPMSPRAPSRATNGKAPERPWSPMSGRSRMTGAKPGIVYPPLPESRVGDEETNFPGSPRAKSQVRSKAASVSPSESLSQTRVPVTMTASKTPSRKNTSTTGGGAELPPRSGSRQQQYIGGGRSQPPASVMSGSHQSRPFSPYRHAPTTEDLLHAAVRGRALVIPEEDEKAASVVPSNRSKAPSQVSKAPSQANGANGAHSKALSSRASQKQPSIVESRHTVTHAHPHEHEPVDGDATPRGPSPNELDQEEARIVRDALAGRTPRTSYYAASLKPEEANHFHDMELCVLLHQESDPNAHEFVKKALRKAVRQRVKKLGMKYDNESIRQYKKSYHDHDPSVHLGPDYAPEEPPQWASDIKRELVLMQQRIESLGPKIENLRPAPRSITGANDSRFAYEGDDFTRTPLTQTVNIQTQPTGTAADSMFQGAQSEVVIDDEGNPHHPHHDDDDEFDNMTETQERRLQTDGETHTQNRSHYAISEDRDDSPGQQFLEEELYRLRQRPQGSQSRLSHHSWEVARDDYDEDGEENKPPSGMPTIPDTNGGAYGDRERSGSPPLPALPEHDEEHEHEHGGMVTRPMGDWDVVDDSREEKTRMTPWQLIHARLLSWAVIWPMSEVDQALNSTTRGHQVDEVALSIWSTQTYKRYVRARLTDNPPGIVDRLFVPPNMADAISNAVFNGQHGNACGMLRDLWAPFGLQGMPRLLVVLAKHRSEADHWVVHRYSLPDGTLITYDSFPGRTLMDGRPLGWWFAIRIAWPNANYPSPDRLEQKMVRLHRPLQLPIDNSVAAAGIWRNILMGSRGERSLDLERLRDLINTEVKNLRQRKLLGRLSVGPPRQHWEQM